MMCVLFLNGETDIHSNLWLNLGSRPHGGKNEGRETIGHALYN